MRQALALAALFGCGIGVYLWLGVIGVAAFGAGIGTTILTLGIASGYWIGRDPQADIYVTELMAWLREQRRQNGSVERN